MYRAFAIAGLLALTALPLAHAQAQSPTQRGTARFTAVQAANLDKVSAYLNALTSLKSNFVQLGPDGQLDQGEFDLARPGRLRFAYAAPSPTLVVASGGTFYVQNRRLNTLDRYSLSDLPLGILLNQDVNLKFDRSVVGVEEQPGVLVIHARTSTAHTQGNIDLVFSWPLLELRQWKVKDNQGGVTTVALTGTQTGIKLDDALFTVPVKAPRK